MHWANAATDVAGLRVELDAIFGHEDLASASMGVLVVRTDTGEVLYEQSPDRALMPASNQKLITTLGALRFLGPEFTYTTRVMADGKINEQGWLVGDLYLLGAGDPTLTRGDLDDLASQVAAKGVTRVTGSVVADGGCFPGPPLGRGWPWNDETYAYQAQVSGLSVAGNVISVEVTGGKAPGDACKLSMTPESGYLTLDRACRTGDAEAERPSIFRRRASNVVAASGPVPPGVTVSARVTLEDPALHLATLFARSLDENRIRAGGGLTHGDTPDDAIELAAHVSEPLADILVTLNVPSDNNIAESLLRTTPLPAAKPGTAGAGMEMIAEYLEEIGIDIAPLRLCDGSGLSRLNLVTPRAFVGLLRHVAATEDLREPFIGSLPTAGETGTLRRRMVDTPADGKVYAKTGSLWGVCALSGYIDGRDDCELTFSFLMNNYTCGGNDVRRLQDRACVVLREFITLSGE